MPSPPAPVAFALFGLEIRWYALFFLAGTLAGIWLARWLAGRLALDRDWVLDAAPWIVLSSIIGARLYYVLLRAADFAADPLAAFNIRQGGLSFHGALIAGFLAFVLLCHRDSQPLWRWTDAAIPGVALAQAIGRWGNWANQEAFGTPTTLPWGLAIDLAHRPLEFAAAARFHPTFLYESLFNLTNAIVLSWVALRIPRSSRLRHGDVLAIYLISYGVARFAIERLRTDSLYIGPLPAAYWLSWLLIAAGLTLFAGLRISNAPERARQVQLPD
jgi:phosphatidylglycerol:prolipoprotein diacylglycerol transferase